MCTYNEDVSIGSMTPDSAAGSTWGRLAVDVRTLLPLCAPCGRANGFTIGSRLLQRMYRRVPASKDPGAKAPKRGVRSTGGKRRSVYPIILSPLGAARILQSPWVVVHAWFVGCFGCFLSTFLLGYSTSVLRRSLL